MMDIQAFTNGIALGKQAVDLAAGAVNFITDSTKREAAKTALEQSKKAFALAEVQVAEQLDYPLCHCEFPPVICTQNHGGRYVCPKCNRDNTPHYGVIN
jgi:transposase-like protein